MRRRLRALDGRSVSEDAGTSLLELVVGMLVMGVFMTIFTGAVVSMARTTTKVEAVTSSAAQVNNAFLRLDKLVRYADAITTAGQGASGGWYVELDTVRFAGTTETHQCTQLWVDGNEQELKLRTWTPVGPTTYTGITLPGWSTLANNITNGTAVTGSADLPFTVPAVLDAASTAFQRLTITLVARGPSAGSSSSTRSRMTFTAVNALASDSTNASKCQQLGAGVLRP